jgi:hypothetical protein
VEGNEIKATMALLKILLQILQVQGSCSSNFGIIAKNLTAEFQSLTLEIKEPWQ